MVRNPLKWPKKLVISAAVLVAAAVALALLSAYGVIGGGHTAQSAGTVARTPAGPAPTARARKGPAPAAVPAVRQWRPVRGPGWRPSKYTRVVAPRRGPLADEARLLAAELKVPLASGRTRARAGDVALRLSHARDKSEGREGYVLTSTGGKVGIEGATDAGVFYGTRTLLQSVRARGGIADGVVHDRPDRPQRGFSIDIARKFFSAEWIRQRVREMGDLKLNQLQLHLSDDQAFRLQSSTHPEVVSQPHLTKSQVRGIVALASSRHIAVIPEFDSPGHLGAVLKAHPELQLRNAAGSETTGALNISRPGAAPLIDDLLHEYAGLFPGRHWHLGGDEYTALTAKDPEADFPGLAAAARKRYGKDAGVADLTAAWLNGRAATLRAEGKIPEVWNDGIRRGGVVRARHDRQVGYWTGREPGERPPQEYLREGWKLVNVNDRYLYYVLGEPNRFTYPTGRQIYDKWTPAVLRGTKAVPKSLSGRDRIAGGRFALWCDQPGAQTPERVARGIRPPLAATAQKLWDPGRPELSWSGFKKLVGRVD
jgi:N-acetyl-beta-hexosaminidase